jgi:hypothetical protein
MAIDIAFNDYLPFLGVKDDDPALNEFLRQFGKKPRRSKGGYYSHLCYKNLGFEVACVTEESMVAEGDPFEKDAYVVVAFYFYGPGNRDGYKVYQGALMADVTLSDSAEIVHRKLGVPSESRPGKTDAAGIHYPPRDFYVHEEHKYVFDYIDDSKTIASVGVAIPTTR